VLIYVRSPSGLRILEEPYKKFCLHGPPPPPPPRWGGGGGGRVLLVVWEIVQKDLPGCEDHLRGWCFGRALLVFV